MTSDSQRPSPQKTPYRGRFAPSPSGPLHWGSLATAVLSWVHARQHDGRWLIRIEDLDPPREIPGMAQRHLADLACYGLESDEPVWFQSQRGEAYRMALDSLTERRLTFECHCSRTDLSGEDGVHRRCVTPPDAARPKAIRLRMPDLEWETHDLRCGRLHQHLANEIGDIVLRRADGVWAYQLAVVVDDAAQDITHVVRGEDLLDSTPRQAYLQHCLSLPTPTMLHLPLLLGPDGRKLSKSEASDGPDPLRPLHSLQRLVERAGWGAPQALAATTVHQLLSTLRDSLDISQLPGPKPRQN